MIRVGVIQMYPVMQKTLVSSISENTHIYAENTRIYAENTHIYAENTRIHAENTIGVFFAWSALGCFLQEGTVFWAFFFLAECFSQGSHPSATPASRQLD